MPINIPKRLAEKLREDEKWQTNVNTVKQNAEKIFERSPYFFEEYTNHGILHINHILEISDKLIPNDSLIINENKISAKTLGIYILSAILHDIGMYITYDNLKYIIENENIKISLLDKYSIKELWGKYLIELKHHSERDLIRKFGVTEIYFPILPEQNKINTVDKLIIGEFLRQNHHKLSHYIINSIMNIAYIENDKEVAINVLRDTNINTQERDLIGLIARSHGENLRDLEEYLAEDYESPEFPMAIEIFYVMSLLRLSDYLDAGEERASRIIENMYVKNSEISKEEFKWNQCVIYDNYLWNIKKQCLVIDAFPKNGYYFSKVTKWVKSVQQELDLCWAIISEFYNVKTIKFSIRRINSNLLKEKTIEKTKKKFYPAEVYFDTNPDISKLLIKPLYGDNPSYGVRELVQNAVDACREREVIEKEKGNSYSGAITVDINTTEKTFIIKDNGTGMTIDTIVNYYLKAGASYRNSSAWYNDFLDDKGNSKVSRSGKFGIGVLATFLLGAEATIKTKSIKDNKGWHFTFKQVQDNIEIKRDDSIEYGTVITVELSDNAVKEFLKNTSSICWYRWYFDKNPTIQYTVDRKIKERTVLDPFEEGWYRLEQNEYKSYYWSYNDQYLTAMYKLGLTFCNGIAIEGAIVNFNEYYDCYPNTSLRFPNIYVQDKRGNLPVNLSRSKLTEIPCLDALFKECFKYYIAQLLIAKFDKSRLDIDVPKFFSEGYPKPRYDFVIYSVNGFIPNLKPFRRYASVENYRKIFSNGSKINLFEAVKMYSNVILVRNNRLLYDQRYIEISLGDCRVTHAFLTIQYYNHNRYMLYRVFDNLYNFTSANEGDHILCTRKEYNDDNIKGKNYKRMLGVYGDRLSMVIEYYEDYSKDDDTENELNSIIMNLLKEYFGDNKWIPYDIEDRKKAFPKAFEELAKYMK